MLKYMNEALNSRTSNSYHLLSLEFRAHLHEHNISEIHRNDTFALLCKRDSLYVELDVKRSR